MLVFDESLYEGSAIVMLGACILNIENKFMFKK